MSRAWAAVRFDDGVIKFAISSGASDCVVPSLHDSFAWDMKETWTTCTCGSLEPCEIVQTYGWDEHWRGLACRKCMAIDRASLEPPKDVQRGLPVWAQEAIGK